MIAIVDYGAGNLFSVQNALAYLNITCCTTDDPAVLEICDGVILPGVGAFPEAMHRLHASGLVSIICEQAQKKPLLGICLGMQMLFERSYEFEETQGLGLIPGQVRLINSGGLKIPHMGWNDLAVKQASPLTDGLDGQAVYFVHSYFTDVPSQYIDVTADYSIEVPAMIHKDNVYGAQFHPEKSGDIGLGIIEQFVGLCKA